MKINPMKAMNEEEVEGEWKTKLRNEKKKKTDQNNVYSSTHTRNNKSRSVCCLLLHITVELRFCRRFFFLLLLVINLFSLWALHLATTVLLLSSYRSVITNSTFFFVLSLFILLPLFILRFDTLLFHWNSCELSLRLLPCIVQMWVLQLKQ